MAGANNKMYVKWTDKSFIWFYFPFRGDERCLDSDISNTFNRFCNHRKLNYENIFIVRLSAVNIAEAVMLIWQRLPELILLLSVGVTARHFYALSSESPAALPARILFVFPFP